LRRLPLLSFFVVGSLLFVTAPSFGAIKAGATCKQVGKIATNLGIEYRCVKNGKKLVWKKITKAIDVPATPVVTPTPTPTASPSSSPSPTQEPTPTPTPSLTPTPTPTPTPTQNAKPLTFAETLWSRGINGKFPIEDKSFDVPVEIPTSWQDVYEKRLGIPYQAWLAISKNVASNPSKVGNVEFLTGPNTASNNVNLEKIINLTSRAVPSGINPKNVRIFVFNFKDANWADQQFKNLYSNESAIFKKMHPDPVWEICPKNREVCYQQSFIDSNLNGVIFMGLVDKGTRAQIEQTYAEFARTFLGQVIAHEYLHTIEAIHVGERRYIAMERTPTWFSQGAAVFVEGAAPNYQTFDGFMRFRLVDSATLYDDCPYSFCIKLNANLIQDYLSLSHQEKNWDNFPYGMKYMMSARVVEILVALNGPDSIIRMFAEIGRGKRFDQAFETVYGVSYESAKPIIARIVADQFANGR
jgi:hypothetical protein